MVERSNDRVGKYACGVNANALAPMPGGEDSPDDAALVDLSSPAAERGGEGNVNLFGYRIIINGTKFNRPLILEGLLGIAKGADILYKT